MALATLKNRSEFLRVRGGRRWACTAFVIEAKPRPSQPDGGNPRQASIHGPRFGFTVTRKIGSAVIRNRIRRRLREALRTMLADMPLGDIDYVVIVRGPAPGLSFAELHDLLSRALRNLQRDRAKPSRPVTT